jgi:hypothetical protein
VRKERPVAKSAAKVSAAGVQKAGTAATTTPGKKGADAPPTLVSPLATSRAGRKNSPRIDYRTGKRLEMDSQSSEGAPAVDSPGRRPLRTIESPGQSSVASVRKRPVGAGNSNSPVLKKKSLTELAESGRDSSGTRRSGRSQARRSEAAGTLSEEEEVVHSTPPARTGRYGVPATCL